MRLIILIIGRLKQRREGGPLWIQEGDFYMPSAERSRQSGSVPRDGHLTRDALPPKNPRVVTEGMELLMPTSFLLALVFLAGGLGAYALWKGYNLKLVIKDWLVLEARRPRRHG